MTEQEFEIFNNFINDLLYNKMSIEDYYFIMNRLGSYDKNKRFKTICHNENSIEANYNLAFIEESRTFYCFSYCNCSYSLLSLIKKVKGLKTYKALQWLCNELNIPFDFKEEIKNPQTDMYNWKRMLSKYSTKFKNETELTQYDKGILNYFDSLPHEDWINYGISKKTLDKYNIKWYERSNQIVIPVFDKNGELVGIRGRNMNPQYETKYIPLQMLDGTMYNFPTNKVMFGENYNSDNIRRRKKVALVESEKTVMKADEWFGEDNNICLGLFGSTLSKDNIKYLLDLQIETAYICLDSDFIDINSQEYENFENKVIKMYRELKPYISKIYVVYNNIGLENCYKFSITDYTKDEFDLIWNNKELIDL